MQRADISYVTMALPRPINALQTAAGRMLTLL